MTNTDKIWTVTNIVVELKLLDGNGVVVQTMTAKVRNLAPGDRGDYSIIVPVSTKFELNDIHATWDWQLPG